MVKLENDQLAIYQLFIKNCNFLKQFSIKTLIFVRELVIFEFYLLRWPVRVGHFPVLPVEVVMRVGHFQNLHFKMTMRVGHFQDLQFEMTVRVGHFQDVHLKMTMQVGHFQDLQFEVNLVSLSFSSLGLRLLPARWSFASFTITSYHRPKKTYPPSVM